MKSIRIVWQGKPITKKNSQRIFRGKGGRPFIKPSAAYEDFAKRCTAQTSAKLRNLCIAEPVNVCCEYFMPTHHRVDLTNLLEATHDILVTAGVLADDCSGVVESVDGSRVHFDKDNPRTEITITKTREV